MEKENCYCNEKDIRIAELEEQIKTLIQEKRELTIDLDKAKAEYSEKSESRRFWVEQAEIARSQAAQYKIACDKQRYIINTMLDIDIQGVQNVAI